MQKKNLYTELMIKIYKSNIYYINMYTQLLLIQNSKLDENCYCHFFETSMSI